MKNRVFVLELFILIKSVACKWKRFNTCDAIRCKQRLQSAPWTLLYITLRWHTPEPVRIMIRLIINLFTAECTQCKFSHSLGIHLFLHYFRPYFLRKELTNEMLVDWRSVILRQSRIDLKIWSFKEIKVKNWQQIYVKVNK